MKRKIRRLLAEGLGLTGTQGGSEIVPVHRNKTLLKVRRLGELSIVIIPVDPGNQGLSCMELFRSAFAWSEAIGWRVYA